MVPAMGCAVNEGDVDERSPVTLRHRRDRARARAAGSQHRSQAAVDDLDDEIEPVTVLVEVGPAGLAFRLGFVLTMAKRVFQVRHVGAPSRCSSVSPQRVQG